VQRCMVDRGAQMAEIGRIEFRMSINLLRHHSDSDDIFGGAVEVAARPEELAEPGGICVSDVGNALDLRCGAGEPTPERHLHARTTESWR
jgi:class 3 adenylate cyclase